MDLFAADVIAVEWTGATSPPVPSTAAETEADRLIGGVTASCDMVLRPRNPHPGRRPPVHWCNGSVVAAHTECVRRRRLWFRRYGRNDDGVDTATEVKIDYHEAQNELRHSIREAKALHSRCEDEVMVGVGQDRRRRSLGETL